MSIKIISAGAGSGKTYYLTEEMSKLLRDKQVRASGIIATTFTDKSAAEIATRVRTKLLSDGLTDAANDLSNALIGTVHGLGVKLLRRFAFEAGVSPRIDIIAAEDQSHFFNLSLSRVLTLERIEKIDEIGNRFGFFSNSYSPVDWRNMVSQLTDGARVNDFGRAELAHSKTLSVNSFLEFLKPPAATNELEAEIYKMDLSIYYVRLTKLITETIEALEANGTIDTTATTKNVIEELKKIRRKLGQIEGLEWYELLKISKLKSGVKSKELLFDVQQLATAHLFLPAFHLDIKMFIEEIFDISADALEEYDHFKRTRGLIDYTDMEVQVNRLLDNSDVREALRAEIDLLLVDEFQDTSPIQLEIFLKLAKIAKQSIWVGDPKQSIYGFRGAEPRLMQAIINKYGVGEILDTSWRSRGDIVRLTNAIFCKAFAEEMPISHIALRENPKILEPTPPQYALQYWHFHSEKKVTVSWTADAIAQAIKELLLESKEGKNLIYSKGESIARPAREGDIAVLCRKNSQCRDIAKALHTVGIKAAIAQTGLLDTTEAKLTFALLRYLLNRRDALAVAEILRIGERWTTTAILEHRLEFLESNESTDWKWANEYPLLHSINELRRETAELSPFEILNLLFEELNIRKIVTTWGNSETRLENLDILRSLAKKYEENCNKRHAAASLGGFLLYLQQLEKNKKDEQSAGKGNDAVNILTYHKSKGLEYPIVVCHNLDEKPKDGVFGLSIISETKTVDLEHLLKNRWLRFWVNPYPKTTKNPLLDELLASERQSKLIDIRKEDARLLYVGITRARSYVILPAVNDTSWLNQTYHGAAERPTLDDANETIFEWEEKIIKQDYKAFYFETLPLDDATPQYSRDIEPFLEAKEGKNVFVPYEIDLEKEGNPQNISILEFASYYTEPLLRLENKDETIEVSRALHTYLLGTNIEEVFSNLHPSTIEMGEEIKKIENLLIRFDVLNLSIAPRILESRLFFVKLLMNQFQPDSIFRRYPLRHHLEGRLISFEIDFVLIPHYASEKSVFLIQNNLFSGDPKQLRTEARRQGTSLELVLKSAPQLFGKKCQLFIHFPVFGILFEVVI